MNTDEQNHWLPRVNHYEVSLKVVSSSLKTGLQVAHNIYVGNVNIKESNFNDLLI